MMERRKKLLIVCSILLAFLLIWVFWLRNFLVVSLSHRLWTVALFYYASQYGIILYLFLAEGIKFKRILMFVLIGILFNGLVFGLPFIYTTNGLTERTLDDGSIYSEDVFLGLAVEHYVFKCSSYTPETYNLPACSTAVKWFNYILMNLLTPFLILMTVFVVFWKADKKEYDEMVGDNL